MTIATQNAEPWKDHRSKEVAGCSGYDEINHSMEGMNKLVNEKVIRKTLEVTILKNGQPDLSLYGDQISRDVKLIISEVDRYPEPEPVEGVCVRP